MSEDRPQAPDQEATEDESQLDAGLRAGFGPLLAVADAQLGLSVLSELEDRLGGDTVVSLRREPGDEGDGPRRERDGARYRMLGEIARGGMGVIIRSRDTDLGRDVAMKILQPRHADNRGMVQRFIEEAQIAGQLQHPGILQVYELGLQPDRRPYFTMKLIKGRTLAALLDDRRAAADDRRRFLNIVEHVCQTMAYAHSRGVIHRDLKPANVMVGNFGEVQIVDWGLAKLLATDDEDPDRTPPKEAPPETVIEVSRSGDSSQTMAGSVMGTPAYMSPEQARGEVDQLDERTDVFALGAMLCEILTGEPPYIGDATDALEDAKGGLLDEAFARLDGCGADEDLISLTRSCLAPRRRDRLRDASEVASRVTAHLASIEERGRKAELAAVEARATAAEEQRTRRRTVVLAATVLLAVVLGGSGIIWSQRQQLQHIAAASEQTNKQLDEAMRLLVEAKETPVSDDRPWVALRAAGAQVAALHGAVQLDEETRQRATAFLDEFSQADRDRRTVEKIEELVITGATHEDPLSWTRMEEQLRQAFLEYGIDLQEMSHKEVAARIRESDLAPQLTDGLELWIATLGTLALFGESRYTTEEMLAWAEVLYEADRDPYRTSVRRQVYVVEPDGDRLRELAHSADFDRALPRTLAWLGNTFLRVGDMAGMDDVYRRALLIHPTDFMLNFDYAWCLAAVERWQEAIRYYHRALAIRPKTAGMWRNLGVALRKTGDFSGSIDAFTQAIRYQPDHAPTHVDLGFTLADIEDLDGAVEAYGTALSLNPEFAEAHCHLGRVLQRQGRLDEALAALERGHELGSGNPAWALPSGQWIDECRRLLQVRTRAGRPTKRYRRGKRRRGLRRRESRVRKTCVAGTCDRLELTVKGAVMKFRLVAFGFACGVALTLMTCGWLAQDAAAQQSEQDKWFEGFKKYGMPGKPHEKLELLAGKWDVSTKIWHEGPDNPPMVSTSKMRSELILGGRFLQTWVHGTINVEMGGEVRSFPIESMGIAGYDRFKEKYVSIWMSSSSTGIWYSEGVPDEAGNVITYFGTGDEWETGTRNKPYKIVDRMVDDNTCVTEMFDILGGPDQNRVFEMTARRITE